MNRRDIVPAVLVGLVLLGSGARYAFFYLLRSALPAGSFGFAIQNCPRCGASVTLHPGKETACRTCSTRLALCAYCGQTLVGPEQMHRFARDPHLYCAEHRAELEWQAEQVRECDGPDGKAPLPDTPRARAARRLYETKVEDLYRRGYRSAGTLFDGDGEGPPPYQPVATEGNSLPKPVLEAYGFYKRAWMDRDNGSVNVYRWDLDGKPLYIVHTDSDGSDGWVELYDGDGAVLAYARTGQDCPVWAPKGPVRRCLFVGSDVAELKELQAATKRYTMLEPDQSGPPRTP